jgi:hypothetical protein
MKTCIQPVDLPAFTQFCEHFPHECRGLLTVGPIIELNFDDINLFKPIQFTLTILVQSKKKIIPPKPTVLTTDTVNNPQESSVSQISQQEIIAQQQQQQQLIFNSMLGEG